MAKNASAQLLALRSALIDGEQSGPPAPFDFDGFLLKKAKRARGNDGLCLLSRPRTLILKKFGLYGRALGRGSYRSNPAGLSETRVGSHFLFFRVDRAGQINIVRILHHQMDVPAHLQD